MDYCCNKRTIDDIVTGHNVSGVLWSIFFAFKNQIVLFFAAMSALVHGVEAVHDIWLLLTEFRNYF